MTCSGIHRKLGTHLSQVRSVTLDTWTPAQIARFQKLGNAKAAKYFEACLPPDYRRPHSSDNMRMEAFIRDKYENKRYITVENGGLGGAPPGRFGASSVHAHVGTLGPRPLQEPSMPKPYDYVGRSTSSMSYASRFQNDPPPPIPTRTPQQSAPKSHLDAVTRATTLRELVNMGFPTQLALRAVEAASGDLQRAIDWLLQDAANAPPSKSAPAFTTNPPPAIPTKPVAADLLDFSDTHKDTPTDKYSTVTKSEKTPDFADFGAFEKALPTTSSVSTSAMPSAQASKSLSSSLADLYKQKRPMVPPPPPSDEKSPAFQSSKPSPTQTRKTTSAMTAGGQSTQNMKIGLPDAGLKPNTPSSNGSQRQFGYQNQNPIYQTSTASNGPPPPPPPPMQEAAFPTSEDGPLPPSPTKQSVSTTSAGGLRNTDFSPGTGQGPQVRNSPKKLEKEEDQDPFAALSMMALSSATSSKKQVSKSSAVSGTNAITVPPKDGTGAPESPGFDNFFG